MMIVNIFTHHNVDQISNVTVPTSQLTPLTLKASKMHLLDVSTTLKNSMHRVSRTLKKPGAGGDIYLYTRQSPPAALVSPYSNELRLHVRNGTSNYTRSNRFFTVKESKVKKLLSNITL